MIILLGLTKISSGVLLVYIGYLGMSTAIKKMKEKKGNNWYRRCIMSFGLYEGFESFMMPLGIEFGKILFSLSMIGATYVLMRCDVSESIKKMKMATIGYAILKCVQLYIEFVDNIVGKIHF